MTFENFVEKMKAAPYSDDYVEEINGDKILFSYYDKAFYKVNDYKEDERQITHACLERHINKKVNLINFIRDVREDWGDDGGFCFYVGQYEGRYILGSNYISYNNDFSKEFIEINKLEKRDENEEYMFFDTLEDIERFINEIVSITKELTEADPDWGYECWEMEEEGFKLPFLHKCIRNLGSAFCEYQEQNIKRLKSLTDPNAYTKRTYDPIEFYNSWIKENNIKPILKL